MSFFILIFGILSFIFRPLPTATVSEQEPSNPTFLIPIQQDSTPPIGNKGVVKIKELENPKKRKKAAKAQKNSSQQVVIKNNKSASKKTTPSKRVTAAKAKKSNKKKKSPTVVSQVDTSKTPSSNNSKKKRPQQKLSSEEEIKLLAKTPTITTENKIHPESAENCRFAFDVIDEFTGVQKRGLDARPFFTYTPDEYRKFIQEGDFIRCEGFLSQSSEGGMALNINLYVASREAKLKFGAIKANSAMVLRTMEGKEYFLMTYPGAAPQVVDNITFYQCSFAINKSDLKQLQKAEIDQVKISFQKGFQSYDVFYLDFLMDQFPCFEQ